MSTLRGYWLRCRPWVEPAVAVVIGLLSIIGMIGSNPGSLIFQLAICVAIGTAGRLPQLALPLGAVGAVLGSWSSSILSFGGTFGYGDATFIVVPTAALVTTIVAFHHRGRLRWITLAIAIAVPIFAWQSFTVALVLLFLDVALWGIAVALNEGTARVAALQETARVATQLHTTESSLSLADERNRLAQEMHDVVAHSLAVIVAQADGARYLKDARPQAMADALEAIAGSARSALLDVQGMIDGMLDGTEAPQPTLEQLPELIEGSRGAGLEVTQVTAGEPAALGLAQQAAAYRIVQEGLTNALRHRGRGSSVSIVFDWRGPGLSIQLVSSGEGEQSALETRGSGRGVTGMQERARLAGGWLADGADESGDHRLTAFIPYRDLEAEAQLPTAAALAVPVASPDPAAPTTPGALA